MPIDDLTALGQKMREARKKKDPTQQELADLSHVSIKDVYKRQELSTVAAVTKNTPVNPKDTRVMTVFFLLRLKFICAIENGVMRWFF